MARAKTRSAWRLSAVEPRPSTNSRRFARFSPLKGCVSLTLPRPKRRRLRQRCRRRAAVRSVDRVRDAVADADICVTCTTSKSPALTEELQLRGCFVAAVGADNPEKHEIAPALMRRARILVDDIDACASGGDLNHALRAGTITKDQVHA